MFKLDKSKYNPLAKETSIIQGEKYRITVLSANLIRFEYHELGEFQDNVTTMVVNREFPDVEFKHYKKDGLLYLETENLVLTYDEKCPSAYGLQIRVLDSAIVWNYGVESPSNLGGTYRTLDGVDGAIDIGKGLLSKSGYAVIDDSNSAIIDTDGWFQAADSNRVDIYFFGHGRNYQAAINDFYNLSGSTPLLPRYVFGNWWSRYHKYDENEYRSLIEKFNQKGVPLSVAVIDMDWHITDVDPKYLTGWTGYTWNKELFPDPARFLQYLHDQGLKTTLNIHPAEGIRPFEVQYNAMCKQLGLDPANDEIIEFDFTNPEFVKAYFEQINHPYEEEGVDFWWLDWQQGTVSRMEGLDPLWPLNHYYYLDSVKSPYTQMGNSERGLTFSRYAGLGSHRYPIGFSGDTVVSWDSLRFQPYFTSSASNVGYTWWSHDIGGHFMGVRDDELITRWVQLGVFSPILRLHSNDNPFLSKEPWNYRKEAEEAMTEALLLRQRLIPYLYTMNFVTAYENIALIRPMYYEYPYTERAYQVNNEYYFGKDLIACPITDPIDNRTQVAKFSAWLPEGDYFDFFSGRYYLGNKNINIYRNFDEIPVFAKAGAIIPLDNAEVLENGSANPEKLLLRIFTGADGQFKLIEDSFEKVDPQMEDLAVTNIDYSYNAGNNAHINIVPSGDLTAIPENREIVIELVGAKNSNVYCNGKILDEVTYDEERSCLRINLGKIGREPIDIVITDAKITKLGRSNFIKNVFNLLNKMQIDYEMKREIFALCQEYGNAMKLLSTLYAVEHFDDDVINVIAELIYSEE